MIRGAGAASREKYRGARAGPVVAARRDHGFCGAEIPKKLFKIDVEYEEVKMNRTRP